MIDYGKNSFRWSQDRGNFTEPTTCPICGGMVYFIRHNGGSVWLDCLGYPWDKHGCFDEAPIPNSEWKYFLPSHLTYQRHINNTVKTHKMLHKAPCPRNSGTIGIIVEAELHKNDLIRVAINIRADRTIVWFISKTVDIKDIVGCLALVDLEANKLYLLLDGFVVECQKQESAAETHTPQTPHGEDYVVGDKINHSVLGVGTITEVEKNDQEYKLTVHFGSSGTSKKIMANVAHIQKLE